MKKVLAIVVISFIILITGLVFWRFQANTYTDTISIDASTVIDGKVIHLQIVRTPDEIRQGLSGKKALGEDQGMLFVMPTVDRHSFWMKDMNFPLDIIFLRQGRVVDLVTLEPPTLAGIPTYESKEDADMVLELPKGMALKYQLKLGTQTDLAQYR